MYSSVTLLPLFLAISTLISQSLANPVHPGSATITTPPRMVKRVTQTLDTAYNTAASIAASQAASAAEAYSAAQSYSAEESSNSAYYATASASGSKFAAAPSATGPDACGPKIPDPSVADTCQSFVEKVDSPNAYGVQCLRDATGDTLNATSCEQLIPLMCANEFQHAGEWVWASQAGCSVGSYLPSAPGSAVWPAQINCEELIYGAMLEACTDGTASYNVAAVNLMKLPNSQTSGQQVNVGYPSYLIAAAQPRNVGDAGGATANDLDVPTLLAQNQARIDAAFSSESAVLATITGTAAAAALSDLNAYRTMNPTDVGP